MALEIFENNTLKCSYYDIYERNYLWITYYRNKMSLIKIQTAVNIEYKV